MIDENTIFYKKPTVVFTEFEAPLDISPLHFVTLISNYNNRDPGSCISAHSQSGITEFRLNHEQISEIVVYIDKYRWAITAIE